MSNPNKRKGDAFERAVVEFLRSHGHPHVERAYGAGRHDDAGDLDGWPRWIIDCKDHASHDLPGWLDSISSKKRQPDDFGAAIVKRRRKGPESAYVVLTLEDFARLLSEAQEAL